MIFLEENSKTTEAKPEMPELLRLLEESYPQARTALHYNNTFELLLAVMLSAQTTDRQVNIITSRLFPLIKDGPKAVLAMGQERLAKEIQSCGLYRQKSRQIMETCLLLVEKYGGEVPRSREALMSLPGVGRKTANIIMSTAFGIPALAVDTHVTRVSRRLGLAREKKALGVEEELCRLIPPSYWVEIHHRLIAHGRRICRARKPLCHACTLNSNCRYYNEKQAGVF
ncbi:MAG: endonuclease III [Bacillota bacterium]